MKGRKFSVEGSTIKLDGREFRLALSRNHEKGWPHEIVGLDIWAPDVTGKEWRFNYRFILPFPAGEEL